MSLIQGGVKIINIKMIVGTKKRLKEIVKEGPELLLFYPTSQMGPQFKGLVSDLPKDTILLVVGPDPYTSRKWYANIDRTTKGNLRVT